MGSGYGPRHSSVSSLGLSDRSSLLNAGMRATLSCNSDGWGFVLLSHLKRGYEVELRDMTLDSHNDFVQYAVKKFRFRSRYDSESKTLLILRGQVSRNVRFAGWVWTARDEANRRRRLAG